MSKDYVKGVLPVVNCGPGRVKQEFRKRSDINDIVLRYRKNGAFDHVSRVAPVFADVSKIGDFHSVVAKIRAADEAFDALPAVVRKRFHNDPGELVSFLKDSSNVDEAIKLGLAIARKPADKPAPAVVVAPASPPPAPPK